MCIRDRLTSGFFEEKYTSRMVYARPESATVRIYPFSDTHWMIEGDTGVTSAKVTFTVGRLLPNTAYKVTRDGVLISTVTSDASGVITFTHTMTFRSSSGV